MKFAEALTAMESGKPVRRAAMAPNSVYLVKSLVLNGAPSPDVPFYAFRIAGQPGVLSWTPAPGDMQATDWVAVDG